MSRQKCITKGAVFKCSQSGQAGCILKVLEASLEGLRTGLILVWNLFLKRIKRELTDRIL